MELVGYLIGGVLAFLLPGWLLLLIGVAGVATGNPILAGVACGILVAKYLFFR